MKKIFSKEIFFLPLLILTLFISVNRVSADTYISRYYDIYPFYDEFYKNNSEVITSLISYYNTNWSSDYPYYLIYGDYLTSGQTSSSRMNILPLSSNKFGSSWDSNSHQYVYPIERPSTAYSYSISEGTYSLISSSSVYSWNLYFSSNTSLIFETQTCWRCENNLLQLPSYSDLSLNVSYPQMDISNGDIVPTYLSLVNGPTADFTEVNLSNYDYIILSLKNYNQQPFNTTIYSLGSLCFTPVYNYGMTQKNELYPGYQVQACTEDYTSTTPVSIYIIQADLDNNAVYYIKKSNSSTNIVKIPTSVFDITYITSSTTDPQVSIGGRSYPVIPFSDLSDTANKSTDEGYISGQVCSLGDVNCQATQNGMDISDLFTQPLQVLKTLWSSIINVFTLITTFIGLLPITLQAFLYSSFMLAVVLGICKIIL